MLHNRATNQRLESNNQSHAKPSAIQFSASHAVLEAMVGACDGNFVVPRGFDYPQTSPGLD